MKNRIRFGELYQLIFADRKFYIGACLCGAKIRFVIHRRAAINKIRTSPVYKAWRELGEPELVILKTNVPEKDLWLLEEQTIQQLRTIYPYGYNKNPSGHAPGHLGKTHSRKTRLRMSAIQLRYYQDPAAREKNRQGQLKRFENPEERIKARLVHLGKHHSEEAKQKIRIANIGKTLTEEHKEKIRKANLGRKLSKEARKNMILAGLKRRGKYKASKETIEKIRRIHLGRKNTEETKELMRQSALKREARKRWPCKDPILSERDECKS